MDVVPSSQGSRVVSTTVEMRYLNKTDAASVPTFLLWHNLYAQEVTHHSHQLVGADVVSTKAVRPVQLNLCIKAG